MFNQNNFNVKTHILEPSPKNQEVEAIRGVGLL